jgi:hypothetical protein
LLFSCFSRFSCFLAPSGARSPRDEMNRAMGRISPIKCYWVQLTSSEESFCSRTLFLDCFNQRGTFDWEGAVVLPCLLLRHVTTPSRSSLS